MHMDILADLVLWNEEGSFQARIEKSCNFNSEFVAWGLGHVRYQSGGLTDYEIIMPSTSAERIKGVDKVQLFDHVGNSDA